uniref:Fe2OG dioxygenase domain-containing protein n=1 Tax=Alexandrium monilatum TaxID=311494 RepID=A0A7S4QR13_9DINO|mmetsp:Transcript_76212/g.227153  ORF Transcript_76212/g.227153 Transcript_76212/m.227153 type:complete len:509 (-) Transcript_76212:99-1625(-)
MGGQVWEVIGGGTHGGIVVRRGRSTASPAESTRLATGSRVEELALEGDRLRYRLLEGGSGPESGWVSTSVGQRGSPPKELVVRVSPLAGDAAPAVGPAEVHGASEVLGESPGHKAAACTSAPEDPSQRPLPQELEAVDPPTALLRRGARQLRGVFGKADDSGIFQGLRVELLRVEVDQDERIRQTEGANKLKSVAFGRNASIWSKRLPVHTFVLNKMAELLDVEGLAWWTNLYEDASVDCKFHRDRSIDGGTDADNPNLKPDLSIIASFGATRDFTLRHAATGREFSFTQENGDVMAFDSKVDEDFLHGLHPAKGRGLPRIAVVMVGRRSQLPKPLLPQFVSIWRPAEQRPEGGARWAPRLLQFSGKFSAAGAPQHARQDKNGREVLAPHELAWFAERGSGVSLSQGIAGPGPDAFSHRGVVKDTRVWLERSVDQGMFDAVMKNLITNEAGDRLEQVEFHVATQEDPASARIPRLIRVTWRGRSEDDVEAKHAKLLDRLRHDLGLLVQ